MRSILSKNFKNTEIFFEHKKIVTNKLSIGRSISPLRYPGGKTHISKKIIPYLPDLDSFQEYRELFLGGGSMAVRI